MKLKVACVQYNPVLGELEKNKSKIKSLLSKVFQNTPVDLIILPELAITGYNFKSSQDIDAYLDRTERDDSGNISMTATSSNAYHRLGSSMSFAKELLTSYRCFTVIGYPQLFQDKIYNACSLVNPCGQEVYNYRKTFLYETDETWGCNENPDKSFKSIDVILDKEYYLNNELVSSSDYTKTRINFGICMDLNPYKFEAPFNKFEFALSCYNNQSNLIICPMAWLTPFSPSIKSDMLKQDKLQEAKKLQQILASNETCQINILENDNVDLESCKSLETFTPSKPDYSTINYHILRFFPFLNHKYNMLPKLQKVNVITCNRIGVEDDIVYGGSSSMFEFNPDSPGNDEINYLNPSVDLKGYLSQGTEGVLYRELDL